MLFNIDDGRCRCGAAQAVGEQGLVGGGLQGAGRGGQAGIAGQKIRRPPADAGVGRIGYGLKQDAVSQPQGSVFGQGQEERFRILNGERIAFPAALRIFGYEGITACP